MTDFPNNRKQDGSIPTDPHGGYAGGFRTAVHADGKGPDGTMPPVNGGGTSPSGGRHWKTGEVILHRYMVIELLGQGGMGVVYRCRDKNDGTDVAVKALPPEVSRSSAEMEKIRENFALVKPLDHKNIAHYLTLEKDESSGDFYVVMEYVEGEDLRHWMKRLRKEGKMTLAEALPVLRQIAEALDDAHRQDVIHRDVKPDNVKIKVDGTVKILDFGLATQIRTSYAHVSNKEDARAGTNLYKSPEQWLASTLQDASTDQYSLAVVAYEMLSGHVPFESDDKDILQKAVLYCQPKEIEGLPKYVNTALMAGLAKEASGRYATCMDFVRALGGEKVKPKGGRTSGKKWIRRTWLAVAAVAALLVLARFLYVLSDRAGDNPPNSAPRTPSSSTLNTESPEAESVEKTPSEEATGGNKQPEQPESLDNECRNLVNCLERFLNDDYGKTWDREQTVGTHMDAFMKYYNDGYDDMENEKRSNAYENFKKADGEREWLVVNIPLRKQAADARGAAEEKKKKAESANADLYAHNDYVNAKNQLDEAAMMFESGEFGKAKVAFGEAGDAFGKATVAASRKHLDELVSDVEDAIRNGRFGQAEKDIAELERLSSEKYNEMKRKAEEARKLAEETVAVEAKRIEEARKDSEKSEKIKLLDDQISKAIDNEDFPSAEKAISELWFWDGIKSKIWTGKLEEVKKAKAEAMAKKKKDSLLKAAADALKARRWQEAYSKAEEVLKEEEDNIQARKIKEESYDMIRPKARIIALLNGEEVKAGFADVSEWHTPKVFDNLKEGESLKGRLICRSNGKKYEGMFDLCADWSGMKEVSVNLEEMIELNVNGVVMTLKPVKAGQFFNTDVRKNISLQYDYWIGETEVTQEQYMAVMGVNPSAFKSMDNNNILPVENVTWDDARNFCKKLGKLCAGSVSPGYGIDLPTEAQWEYAARGGNKSKKCKFSGGNNLDDVGWYYANSGKTRLPETWDIEQIDKNACSTHPVGQKASNELGLFDMSGNVQEWCRDAYDSNWGNDPELLKNGLIRWGGRMVNGGYNGTVSGVLSGTARVIRGGSWYHEDSSCNSSFRNYMGGREKKPFLGFRIAIVKIP